MQDPVCGMNATPQSKGGSAEWKDETYYFCSEKCRKKFVADPESYLNPEPPTDEEVDAAAEYDERRTSPEQLKATVKGAGYTTLLRNHTASTAAAAADAYRQQQDAKSNKAPVAH